MKIMRLLTNYLLVKYQLKNIKKHHKPKLKKPNVFHTFKLENTFSFLFHFFRSSYYFFFLFTL